MFMLAADLWSWRIDGWIVGAGLLCALSCALLGNFLVLRRMSMMGDAISHAVLPGLAAAFLISGSRESWIMFVGAAAVGVLTAVFTQWVHSFGKVEESASMGVVFTALFAVGLIMIVQAADHVDLDPSCVLYGQPELIAFDAAAGGIPPAIWKLGAVLVVDALFVLVFYKELKISSFDPELATTLGINARLMHYLLMTLVAATTVASFESVGSILVVAMLIVPPATAYLLTERLWAMIGVSLVVATASAVAGHLFATTIPTALGWPDTITSGMMAVVAGVLFIGALLLSPRHGVVSKAIDRMLLSLRVAREDFLGLLYRAEELGGPDTSAPVHLLRDSGAAGPMMAFLAARDLLRRRQIAPAADGYRLTEAGRDQARQLVRSHRLWEGYLRSHMDLPVERLHRPAEVLEHVTNATMQEQLADSTDRPDTDPQGKSIPPA